MIDPRHSRPIDVHRWSDHPEINILVSFIWAEHFTDYHPKTSGPKPKTRFKDQLKVLLLDLYVAWTTDPELAIGVSMSVNAWKTGSRYNALHLSKIILTFIHRLEEVGLIELSKGSYAGPGVKSNRSTRIRAAAHLRDAFAQARWSLPDIEVAEGRETVILRSGDGSTQVEYEDTDRTREMRAFLEKYNDCLSDNFIDLPGLDTPVIERVIRTGKRAGDTQRIPIGPTNAFVRRVFSRGRWDLNGRFYGGWWQQIDKATRAHIFIDDEPTVEVDFRGLHVAILSKEKGIRLDGDPYELQAGILPGTSRDDQRAFVKQLVLTAINARNERSTFSAFREGYPAGSPGKALKDASLRVLLAAFVEKHPHLGDSICTDQGIRLMNVDSQIAEEVLKHFTDQRLPVLCIHDSFIVHHDKADELISVMQEITTHYLGGPLSVSQDYPGLDQFLSGPGDPTEAEYLDIRQLPDKTEGYLHRRDRFFEDEGGLDY